VTIIPLAFWGGTSISAVMVHDLLDIGGDAPSGSATVPG
jgi:hypothetical protein